MLNTNEEERVCEEGLLKKGTYEGGHARRVYTLIGYTLV
jgi:hypothetical protein